MAQPPTPPPPEQLLFQLIMGKWVSMAVSVAAKLRIADLLAAGPKSIADLAGETKTHPASLFRILRALASLGVFAEDASGKFGLAPLGEFLRTGVPGSLRGIADFCGTEWSWKSWGHLLDSVRTGDTAFDRVYGESVFQYLAKHPDESAVFNEGMTGFSKVTGAAVVKDYDFSGFGTIVDVGGGHGSLLIAILEKAAKAKGIVFDSPHVAAGAPEALAKAGLANRCKAEGGDFFAAVPSGGDAYVMKHILHDWDDARAITILKNCRKAANKGAKLLLVEMVVPPGNDPHPAKFLDLEMLVVASGKERTEAEWHSLLAAAGWTLKRIVPTKSPVCVIEGE